MKFLVTILIVSQAMANHEEDDYAKVIIEKTESQYRSIKDYQVKMTISMKIPAFRMPKKKYTVFFKQPDKLEIKSRGFGLLPRTGMFTSPSENFDNLTEEDEVLVSKAIDLIKSTNKASTNFIQRKFQITKTFFIFNSKIN